MNTTFLKEINFNTWPDFKHICLYEEKNSSLKRRRGNYIYVIFTCAFGAYKKKSNIDKPSCSVCMCVCNVHAVCLKLCSEFDGRLSHLQSEMLGTFSA